MGEGQRGHDLVAAAGLDQPVRRAADPERRQRRERHVTAHAIGSERGAQRLDRRRSRHLRDASTAISARSCAISAAIASAGEHTTNEIVSPGPS